MANYTDIAFPLNNETRQMIEEKVLAAYQQFADEPVRRRGRE
jgi:DNA-binding cell septation regulator SpoVG